MKIKPLFDRIILKEVNAGSPTKSGIIMPSSMQEKPITATVIAVGEGEKVDGEKVEIVVKVGDKVVLNKYSASEFNISDEKFLIIKQCDILAKIEN